MTNPQLVPLTTEQLQTIARAMKSIARTNVRGGLARFVVRPDVYSPGSVRVRYEYNDGTFTGCGLRADGTVA